MTQIGQITRIGIAAKQIASPIRHPARQDVGQLAQKAFAFLDLGFHFLAARDIQVRANNPFWRAVGQARRNAAVTGDPNPVPVPMQHAEFTFQKRLLAGLVTIQSGFDLVAPIVGPEQRFEACDVHFTQIRQGVADDFGPAFIDADSTARHMPFPSARIGAIQNVGERLFRQLRFPSGGLDLSAPAQLSVQRKSQQEAECAAQSG